MKLQLPAGAWLLLLDKSSVRSPGSLALNNGCALRCCLVILRKDRDGVEVLVEGGA